MKCTARRRGYGAHSGNQETRVVRLDTNGVYCIKNLRKVLDRCHQVNLKLNKKKCRINVKEMTYVGHVLTAAKKITAITEMQAPINKADVQLFLGMTNYLASL